MVFSKKVLPHTSKNSSAQILKSKKKIPFPIEECVCECECMCVWVCVCLFVCKCKKKIQRVFVCVCVRFATKKEKKSGKFCFKSLEVSEIAPASTVTLQKSFKLFLPKKYVFINAQFFDAIFSYKIAFRHLQN